ncbi:hypothetical protein [Pseudomonas sp. RIT-PI-q]|uniref:hypothetical protein n=1 Tax=Pseudomonas sp. RIT-PI-q TaxID=1690247 RepID=UPI0007512C46|nr:hypothetical protein [Pseudomonas sp. RIT-PI-q]
MPAFQALIASLEAKLLLNIQSLSAKVASPSVPIMLTSTADILADLNALVRVEQGIIEEINFKVRDKKPIWHQNTLLELLSFELRCTDSVSQEGS